MLAFFCIGSMLVQAQISTGESVAQTIKTGNRAEKGDFGIYLGATTTMFKDLTSVDEFKALPLINLKYMFSDKLEGRVGIEWWKKSNKSEEPTGEDAKINYSDWNTSMKFYPGIAYHFAKSNILDVYVGGELPFGWSSNGIKNEEKDGAYKYTSEVSGSDFHVGLGAFIGLQAYVCNLPLAIGLEYGVSTEYAAATGLTETNIDGVTTESDNDRSRWDIGHQARFTISYFFKL